MEVRTSRCPCKGKGLQGGRVNADKASRPGQDTGHRHVGLDRTETRGSGHDTYTGHMDLDKYLVQLFQCLLQQFDADIVILLTDAPALAIGYGHDPVQSLRKRGAAGWRRGSLVAFPRSCGPWSLIHHSTPSAACNQPPTPYSCIPL